MNPPLLDRRFSAFWLLWSFAGALIPILNGHWNWWTMTLGWGLLGFGVECWALWRKEDGDTFSEQWWYLRSQGGWGKWFGWQAAGFLLTLALFVLRPDLIGWELFGRTQVATLCVWFAAHVATKGRFA